MPVACSRLSSHEEIVGKDGLYFDPKDKEQIKEAILKLSCDTTKRGALIRNGRERLGKFSWQKCAEETLEVYREVLGA